MKKYSLLLATGILLCAFLNTKAQDAGKEYYLRFEGNKVVQTAGGDSLIVKHLLKERQPKQLWKITNNSNAVDVANQDNQSLKIRYICTNNGGRYVASAANVEQGHELALSSEGGKYSLHRKAYKSGTALSPDNSGVLVRNTVQRGHTAAENLFSLVEYDPSQQVNELTISSTESKNFSAYSTGDIVFTSGNNAGSLIMGNSSEVSGYVKLKKTVQANRWYVIGFPFDIDYVYCAKRANSQKDPFLKAYDSNPGGNYYLRTYLYDAGGKRQWVDQPDGIKANKGYIIQFPDYYNGTEIIFISKDAPTLNPKSLINTGDLETDRYRLLANPNMETYTLNNDAGIYYYAYDSIANNFDLITGGESLHTFESVIALRSSGSPPKSISLGGGAATGIEDPVVVEDDYVEKTHYYTLQGVQIGHPLENGIYIEKKIYQSGREEVRKRVYNK
jgi:hypothetical protein